MREFADIFAGAIAEAHSAPRSLAPGECRTPSGIPCGLCLAMTHQYAVEAAARSAAVREFWQEVLPGVPLDPLVLSPRGREYRTTSKRKAFRTRDGIRLGLVPPAGHPHTGGLDVGRCAIEPEAHSAIYRTIAAELLLQHAAPLRDQIQYAIIKGNYREFTIILNVMEITPRLVRSANGLSRSLSRLCGDTLGGIHLFEGDPDGRYYGESKKRAGVPASRKIFGKNEIYVRAEGRGFLFPPLAFSQVNESILDPFIAGIRRLLRPERNRALVDLYCGYGLFAISLAGEVQRVVGADQNHQAIAAAMENSRRRKAGNCRFIRTALAEQSIEEVMGRGSGSLVILDPPRGGTAPGVIERVALRLPARAVHIFCNLEILPRELSRWERSGYRAARGIPFDMFPGTSDCELMVLLEPGPSNAPGDVRRERRIPESASTRGSRSATTPLAPPETPPAPSSGEGDRARPSVPQSRKGHTARRRR